MAFDLFLLPLFLSPSLLLATPRMIYRQFCFYFFFLLRLCSVGVCVCFVFLLCGVLFTADSRLMRSNTTWNWSRLRFVSSCFMTDRRFARCALHRALSSEKKTHLNRTAERKTNTNTTEPNGVRKTKESKIQSNARRANTEYIYRSSFITFYLCIFVSELKCMSNMDIREKTSQSCLCRE